MPNSNPESSPWISRTVQPICIPFGSSMYSPNKWELEAESVKHFIPRPGVPAVLIDRHQRIPLKFHNARLSFKTSPRPDDLIDARMQLRFLCHYISGLCGQWNKLLKLFVQKYFEDIQREVDSHGQELDKKIKNVKGLCERSHWCFSAMMPLPQAHIYAPDDDSTKGIEARDFVRVDLAFWDGDDLVIIAIDSGQSLIGSKKQSWQRIIDAGPKIIILSSDMIYGSTAGAVLSELGPKFRTFWQDELFPTSPFRGMGIADPEPRSV